MSGTLTPSAPARIRPLPTSGSKKDRTQTLKIGSATGHGLPSFTRFNRYNRDEWVRQQAQRLKPGTKVLDVGAGCGPYRHLFGHCEYASQDFGQEPGTLGNYTPLTYESDITSIPAPDASFDAILCTEVLEHVPEPIAAVREMARLLRPGGVLLLSAPQGSELHQEPYHFYGGYTPYWYKRFLPEAGIEVVEIERNRGFFGLFAQEGARFNAYLRPRHARPRTRLWPLLAAAWFVSIPLFRIVMPLIAKPLDKLQLEEGATVGYHVVGVKRG